MSEPEDDPAEPPRGQDAPKVAAPEVLPEVPAEEETNPVEVYQQRARLAEDRLAEVLAAYRESRKETEKYRERLTRQLQRKYELRHEELLLKFIDILDNFDRALEASQTAGHSLVEGLILVRTQLLQMLQEQGLERIPVLGLPFDPHVSEAVSTVPVDDPDQQGVVVQEMLRGYRIKGKVARASRVAIGEYTGVPVAAAALAEPLIGEVAEPIVAEAAKPFPVEDGPTPPAGLSAQQVEQVVAEAVEAVEAVEAAATVQEIDTTDDAEAALEVAAESADAVEPEIIEVDAEPAPPAQETDGLSLDEIIARAEAREADAHPEPAPDSIMYDDLTELADVNEEVVGEEVSEDGDEREP